MKAINLVKKNIIYPSTWINVKIKVNNNSFKRDINVLNCIFFLWNITNYSNESKEKLGRR